MVRVLPTILIASTTQFGDMPAEEMEKAFWDCDFSATRGVIDLNVAAGCSEVYEQLKMQKFNGDFNRLLLWWQENKDTEFSARSRMAQQRRSH